jgi:hypothetical protein
MEHLTAAARREIIDWIVSGLSGGELYGDERDIPPSDCDLYWRYEWEGTRHTANLRRAHLEALTDEQLLCESRAHHQYLQRRAALMPRPRGRPTGAGSLREADEPFLAQMDQLIASGLTHNAASRLLAGSAPGGGTESSKARRLSRRLKEKKSG